MARWAEREIAGWGRYPRVTAVVARPETRRDVIEAVAGRQGAAILAQGLKRSYGDAALLAGAGMASAGAESSSVRGVADSAGDAGKSATTDARRGRVIDMSRIDCMLAFDPATGWLRCEAGVTIADLASTFLPRGFFPPVVPGTSHVTVAGALASDIHGKNHHVAGSWSNHVRAVEVLLSSGDVVVCDRDQNADLFWATAGGQGLTGIILAMDVRLARVGEGPDHLTAPAIDMQSVQVKDLDGFLRASRESEGSEYTVGWIDGTARGRSIGRGVFMRGRIATDSARPASGGRSTQPAFPSTARRSFIDGRHLSFNWLLNPLSIRAFNSLYYLRHGGDRHRRVTFERFFFQLDSVRNWNRMYGPRGFLQYQFVVPPDPQTAAVRAVLEAVVASGLGPFLGVIKEFGPQGNGGLSFPIPGITVALDFPNTGPKLFALLDRLDDLVAGAGGRVYLSKDARLGREAFRRMYPDWQKWKVVRDRYDPEGVMQSELGRRLGLITS